MTVAELIEKLKEMPQESEVKVYQDYDGVAREIIAENTLFHKNCVILVG